MLLMCAEQALPGVICVSMGLSPDNSTRLGACRGDASFYAGKIDVGEHHGCSQSHCAKSNCPAGGAIHSLLNASAYRPQQSNAKIASPQKTKDLGLCQSLLC